ncbi:S1 family peptidase [Nocardia jiangxiensis]|uniref:S1 family peptidase n=1 Tax=Nocardia jiangxiensis TaxID=282685 RepID=UPI0002FC65AB|nr:S1 family peptidase [Nocardia jiangxiensis]
MKTTRTAGHAAVATVFALMVCAPVAAAAPPAAPDAGSLATAVRRDLGISLPEYQRRADLAQQLAAFAATEQRLSPGSVRGVRLGPDGRAMVAAVGAAARAAAQQAGFQLSDDPVDPSNSAVPQNDRTDRQIPAAQDTPSSSAPTGPIAGGDVYLSRTPPSKQAAKCSWAFNVIAADGTPAALTAGHCNESVLAGRPISPDQQTFPWQNDHVTGPATGSFEKSVVDGIRDYSIVRISPAARNSFRNNLVRGPIGGPAIRITGVGIPVSGAPVCKSGSTTGFTCGVITAVDQPDPQRPPIRFKHTALALPGDSGGALISGTLAMGIISDGGIYSDPSRFPTDRPGVLPPAPPGSPITLGRILQQIGPQPFQQIGPLVGGVLPYVPQIAMIAQSVADVLDQNPGLHLRTS